MINNLISGMLGAIVAILFAELLKLRQNRVKIKQDRKTLVNYLTQIIKPGLETYINDIDSAKEEIRSYPHKNQGIQAHVYDALPSLNSEILKGIDFKELRELGKNIEKHTTIINIYHCIDYLKKEMGYDYIKSYQNFALGHFQSKGIDTVAKQNIHVSKCETMQQNKDFLIRRMDAKRNTALEVQSMIVNCLMNYSFACGLLIVRKTIYQ